MLAQIAGTLLANAPIFLIPFLHLERGLTLVEAGFLAGPRIGTFTYNLVHNWAPGIVTLGIGVWLARNDCI